MIHAHFMLTKLQHINSRVEQKKTMQPKIITEISLPDSNHTRYFRFLLPPAYKDGYRQVVSYNAFFNGERRKNYRLSPRGAETHLYHQQDDIRQFVELIPDVPIIDVLDIFDFYKLIGYDYKMREWRPREGEHGPHVR